MPRFLKISIVVAIVAFWAVMTGWLVRANWNDGNAPFSEMPPMVVFRQMLKHEVASNMGIFHGRNRVGSVTITPLHKPANAVSFDGNLAMPREGGKSQSVNFSIRFDLAAEDLRPETITARFSRRQPGFNLLVEVLLKEQKIRYQIRDGDIDLGQQELPIAVGGLAGAIPGLAGFPPFPMDPSALLKTLEWQANRANLDIRGERMDGYRVRLSAAEVSATATIGQLGELFVLRTSTEYQLLADGLEPKIYLK